MRGICTKRQLEVHSDFIKRSLSRFLDKVENGEMAETGNCIFCGNLTQDYAFRIVEESQDLQRFFPDGTDEDIGILMFPLCSKHTLNKYMIMTVNDILDGTKPTNFQKADYRDRNNKNNDD